MMKYRLNKKTEIIRNIKFVQNKLQKNQKLKNLEKNSYENLEIEKKKMQDHCSDTMKKSRTFKLQQG